MVIAASISLSGIRASDREKDAILTLIRAIRNDARFQCPIIMAVECAPGIAASNVERFLREENIPDVCVMRERRGYLEGVPKTEAITHEYLFELQRALTPGPSGQALLSYTDSLLSYEPDSGKPPAKLALRIKKRMRGMMGNLRKVYQHRAQEHGNLRFSITAKINQSPDDLLIALQIALYWRGVFLRDPQRKYQEWHDIIHTRRPMNFPL